MHWSFMEWVGNLLRVLFNEDPLQPVTDPAHQASVQRSSALNEERNVHNQQPINDSSIADPTARSRNEKDNSIAANLDSGQPSKENSNENNTDTRNVKDDRFISEPESTEEKTADPTNAEDDSTPSPESRLFSKLKSSKENSQEKPVINTVNVEENSLQYQSTNCQKPINDIPVVTASFLNIDRNTVKLAQENNQKLISLLNKLELDPQKKLTLKKALTVDKNTLSDEKLTSSQIPDYILNTLMIVDHRALAFGLNNDSQESSDSDSEDEENKNEEGSINRMDAFLAFFYCCDDFLRQHLAIKLSACQLSVPFLLPHPDQPSEKVTMLLWALQGIKKSWKTVLKKDNNETSMIKEETSKDHEAFMTEHEFPIVTFIRIGENGISKSKLLNNVISDEVNEYHNFFYHKDCKGGGVERKIVDGLVELCWYLPGGREKQAFEQSICFANLRGDARKFSIQMKILSKISSVIIFLLTSKYPDASTKQILQETMKVNGKLVLVFNENREETVKEYFYKLKKENTKKVFTISKGQKNEYRFLAAIRSKIQENANTSPPLESLASLADGNTILLDETVVKEQNTWNDNMTKLLSKDPSYAKKQLKLMSYVPQIARQERENVRPTRPGNKSANNIAIEIQKTKKCQEESFQKMKEGEILNFLNDITLMDENVRNYSFAVLKHRLNKISFEVLGSLQAEHREVRRDNQRIKKERQQQKHSNHLERCNEQECSNEKHLRKLEENIKESSFGLEHIFREMAQLFQLTYSKSYAIAAAKTLLSGQSLELMDGDSSYIPLKWLDAVFRELEALTNKNAKIFVISVLGIQSSGKSTMLNTMFGLEFAVSAGRCTRGAFASLIPLSDSLTRDSKYNYLLIIDTEGLKGSGDPQVRQHDNELATFVIGVADLTIVNILGETYNEMEEFLEIAVHAFLKLKLAKEKRTCKIVHQNVAAINASDMLADERSTLKKKLDKMTKLAAIEEKCEGEFEKLNDILSFDENEDVFYIPTLLQGCPPMAPINPEYGKTIQKVKEKIIKFMCSSEKPPLSIPQFQERVETLWDAILREDFIFSFRNTIEIRAFTSLDQKFFEESMKTMVTQMAELEKTTSASLKRCHANVRDAIWQVRQSQIREKADELAEAMEKEMEVFFETNEDKATLEQWRENIMLKIGYLKENQEAEVKKNCQATFNLLQSRQEIENKKLVYKKTLLAKAKESITSVGETADDVYLQEIFKQKWECWIKDIPPCSVTKINVGEKMKDILCHTKKKNDGIITQMCKKQNNDITNFDSKLPSIKRELEIGYWERAKKLFIQNPNLVIDAESIRDKAIDSAIDFAKEASRSGLRCRESDLKEMYRIIVEILKNETQKHVFQFTDTLTAHILLYSFAKTCPIFEQMENNYYSEHDITLDVEKNLKPDLEHYFLNMCKNVKKEYSAASSFVNVLRKVIISEMNQSMGIAVANEIINTNGFLSKGQFHAKVLIELGEKKSFSYYINYLHNPVKFLKEKLEESIVAYCTVNQSRRDSSVISLLEKQIEKTKKEVFSAIFSANKKVREDNQGIYGWIEEFVENCSTLAITKDMFFLATIDEYFKEFHVFEDQVDKNLNQVFKQVLAEGVNKSVVKEWNPKPFDKLVKLMFGCDKCCPFCRALCDKTMNHENEHSTRIHRPQGITGCQYVESKILVVKICTTNVASDASFRNVHTSNEWHPYKDYKTVNDNYKSWSIPPDSSFEASIYWKWFMATFANELAEHYDAEKPDIPSAWENISFEEAKKYLQEQYKLS